MFSTSTNDGYYQLGLTSADLIRDAITLVPLAKQASSSDDADDVPSAEPSPASISTSLYRTLVSLK